MTIGPGDALFGQDGTGDGIGGTEPVDDIGPLPGLDLSVRLPTVGLDGVIVGLDEFDADIAGSPAPGGGADTPVDRVVPVTGTGQRHPSGPDDEARPNTGPSMIAGLGPGPAADAVGGTGSAITGSVGATPLDPVPQPPEAEPVPPVSGSTPRSPRQVPGPAPPSSEPPPLAPWSAARGAAQPHQVSEGSGPDPPSSRGRSADTGPSDSPAPALGSATPGPADADVPPRTAHVRGADAVPPGSAGTADRRPEAPIVTRPTDHAAERAPDVDPAMPDGPSGERGGPTGAELGAVPPDHDVGTPAVTSPPDAAGPGAASRAPDRPATAITRPIHQPSHGPAHPRPERPEWPVVTRPAWPVVTRPRRPGWPIMPRPVADAAVARPPFARPPPDDEDGILGFSRRARSRMGSRVFTAFFVLVFAVILIQMVLALLQP